MNKNYRRKQVEIKKSKYYESNNSIDASVLSVGKQKKPLQKY